MSVLVWACAIATFGPPIVAAWLALGLGASWVWSRIAGRLLRDPSYYRCAGCGAVFVYPNMLADHLEDDHPELLPRIDA